MHNTTRVSVERVASGTGLVNVYNFLVEAFPERADKTVHKGEETPLVDSTKRGTMRRKYLEKHASK